jgi:hypothetical protein
MSVCVGCGLLRRLNNREQGAGEETVAQREGVNGRWKKNFMIFMTWSSHVIRVGERSMTRRKEGINKRYIQNFVPEVSREVLKLDKKIVLEGVLDRLCVLTPHTKFIWLN